MVAPNFAQQNLHSARLNLGGRCLELRCRRVFFVSVLLVFVLRGFAQKLDQGAQLHQRSAILVRCVWLNATCVGNAPGTAARRMPQTQASTRRQASTSSTSKKQASTAKHKQAGAVKFGQAASFVAPSTSSAFGRMQVPGSEDARAHPFGRQAILCAFADINRLAKQSELCMQLCPTWWRGAGSTLGVIRAHAIAALIRACMCCTRILQLRQVPIV